MKLKSTTTKMGEFQNSNFKEWKYICNSPRKYIQSTEPYGFTLMKQLINVCFE